MLPQKSHWESSLRAKLNKQSPQCCAQTAPTSSCCSYMRNSTVLLWFVILLGMKTILAQLSRAHDAISKQTLHSLARSFVSTAPCAGQGLTHAGVTGSIWSPRVFFKPVSLWAAFKPCPQQHRTGNGHHLPTSSCSKGIHIQKKAKISWISSVNHGEGKKKKKVNEIKRKKMKQEKSSHEGFSSISSLLS